jgi:hypothetical protein
MAYYFPSTIGHFCIYLTCTSMRMESFPSKSYAVVCPHRQLQRLHRLLLRQLFFFCCGHYRSIYVKRIVLTILFPSLIIETTEFKYPINRRWYYGVPGQRQTMSGWNILISLLISCWFHAWVSRSTISLMSDSFHWKLPSLMTIY